MAGPIVHETVAAHIVHSLGIGGLENGLVNLVNPPSPGIRHVIVCMSPDGGFRSRLNQGVEVLSLNKRLGHDLPTFVKLVRLLQRIRPHIVHSRNWATFDAVLAARLAGVPVVIHGEHGREFTDPEGRNSRRNRARRLFAPLVSRFVTVSNHLRRWLVEEVRIPAQKVITIHNGVDTTRFAPTDRAAARAALGLASGQPVIGTVGRLDPVKDHATLIRAFSRVRSTCGDVTLLIAGDGPCKEDLQALVATLGLNEHVRFLGERHDIPGVLAAMDVFVLPSIAEGISNTILEAMAAGLPVVATRVGGNPELVEDGVNGILVPQGDSEALATAVATYLRDPHLLEVHGKSSRLRAVEAFGLERMRGAYANLYACLGARVALMGP